MRQGFSEKLHVLLCHKWTEVWSKFTPNSVTIPCHLSRFYVFHAETWHGFWTSSSHGIAMVFAKKMMEFSDLESFSTKLPPKRQSKRQRQNPCHIFHRVYIKIKCLFNMLICTAILFGNIINNKMRDAVQSVKVISWVTTMFVSAQRIPNSSQTMRECVCEY